MGSHAQPWINYHYNIQLEVNEIAAVRRSGPAMLAASATMAKHLLGELAACHANLGMIGSGWSLSSLLGSTDCMLRTDDLDGIAVASAADFAAGSELDPQRCLFVSGGTKCHQLSYFGELRGLSLPTCGSYLEQSVAGSTATGVIGSHLGRGGFQDMVRGIHVVTSNQRSVWIEPASRPALSQQAARLIADEIVQDDAVFAGALVHLGGMGLINGYLVEMEPLQNYKVMKLRKAIDQGWIAALAGGQYRKVAASLGHDEEPAYYEVQIDPFDPFGREALHTLYFVNTDLGPFGSSQPVIEHSLDGVAAMAMAAGIENAEMAMTMGKDGTAGLPPLPPDVFEHYSREYFAPSKDNKPTGKLTWGEIHSAQAAKDLRGLIYTSAFAVPRAELGGVIQACAKAYKDMLANGHMRHMLFTLRFVSNSAGAMAFTHYPESVVVDMEGISISPHSQVLGVAATAAVRAAGISRTMHWGKLQEADAVDVEATFGPSSSATSAVSLWRRARARLLTDPIYAALLSNAGLRNWGLIS